MNLTLCLLVLLSILVTLATLYRSFQMSAALDRLNASVTANTTATQAAVAEIASLKAGSDDAALNAAADAVDANNAALASAVTPPA